MDDFLGIPPRPGGANSTIYRLKPCVGAENYGSGVGTSLEYEKSSIVIVDDYLPADGQSQSINTFCQSTMQICVAASDHRNPD
ncbi:hypothetical protein [Bradyrhizobium sp. AZCC 1693]|uniref:hypothetical protein n=1 Tax=Bradyrhizobium sp. AZCC 1693 TaxID=3117029 RepID=UPI002FF3EE25